MKNNSQQRSRQLRPLACSLVFAVLAYGGSAVAGQPLFCFPPPPPPIPPCVPENPLGPAQAAARKFITRSGGQLYEGTEKFLRFVSVNAPTLLFDYHWPLLNDSEATVEGRNWQREDVMKSISQFAGRVARTFVITTQGLFPREEEGCRRKHVTWDDAGNMQFDEVLFQEMDRALELANQNGVRLIVPLVLENDAYPLALGGEIGYARAKGGDFYGDIAVRAEFKKFIHRLLYRQNKRTCVLYKDDPAILAWETGNELEDDPPWWTEEIARYIKCFDPNHLVLDGHYGIRDSSLDESSAIDIVSNHYYGDHLNARAVWEDGRRSYGRKPFIVGEFGTNEGGDVEQVREFIDAVISGGAAGALFWQLMPHHADSGFYYHCDGSALACALHWPGFSPDPHLSFDFQHPNEREILSLIVGGTTRINGFQPGDNRLNGVPAPPRLTDITQLNDHRSLLLAGPSFLLRWRGSTGADSYIVERAPTDQGPWRQVSNGVSDNDPEGSTLYRDVDPDGQNPRIGQSTYYRVRAQYISSYGSRVISDPSPVVRSPVASCLGPWTDSEVCQGVFDQTRIDPCKVTHRCIYCQWPFCPHP